MRVIVPERVKQSALWHSPPDYRENPLALKSAANPRPLTQCGGRCDLGCQVVQTNYRGGMLQSTYALTATTAGSSCSKKPDAGSLVRKPAANPLGDRSEDHRSRGRDMVPAGPRFSTRSIRCTSEGFPIGNDDGRRRGGHGSPLASAAFFSAASPGRRSAAQ